MRRRRRHWAALRFAQRDFESRLDLPLPAAILCIIEAFLGDPWDSDSDAGVVPHESPYALRLSQNKTRRRRSSRGVPFDHSED
jgi:hypothetical protein